MYKKSFEIEDIKLEKSNRKTNYNTNQSKNSSSLFNSAHNEHSNRLKHKPEEKVNLDRIQQLIKIQQKSADKEEASHEKVEGQSHLIKREMIELIPLRPFGECNKEAI